MRFFPNIAIIVGAYILSGSAYTTISADKMTDHSLEEPKIVGAYILLGNAYFSIDSIDKMIDHSLEELKKDEIDRAMKDVIQTGKLITQLSDKKIVVSEKISQRFKDQFMSLISLYRSNHSVYGQESKDEFDIWIFKDFKNFYSCINESIENLIRVNEIKSEDIPRPFIKRQYMNIAFNFFLEIELFAEAEKHYMALYDIGKDQQGNGVFADDAFFDFARNQRKKNILLKDSNKDKPQEESVFLAKERVNTLQKYEDFYKTIRGKTQKNLDNKLRDFDHLMIYTLDDLYVVCSA